MWLAGRLKPVFTAGQARECAANVKTTISEIYDKWAAKRVGEVVNNGAANLQTTLKHTVKEQHIPFVMA